ncbi:MAG: J domain-containing protein [Actinomycetota bacterium]|nr:J domain-containing protein [Actinomycetota bacterium]
MALAHEVLGVRPGASPDEVRVAFRRFARLHHPDRGGDAPKFRAGVEAYRRLLGLAAPSSGSPEVVFHRRQRGLEALTAAWRARRARRRRPARVT